MKKLLIHSFTCALTLSVSHFVSAATYTHGQLDNGFVYHIFSTDAEQDYFDVHLQINVGGADERPHEYGSAHMLEHTLFHKSKDFPKGISTQLADSGWKLGEQLNAYTGYENTKFVMTPPRGTEEMDTAFLALQNMAYYPLIAKEDWQREQQIVLAERRNNLGLRGRMAESRRQMLYRGARQADSTLIGTEQDILQREASVLKSFHQRWYQPSNMQLAVIGDVNPEQIEKKIRTYFGEYVGQPVPERGADYYDPALTKGWYIESVKDKQSKNNQVSLMFRLNDNESRGHQSETAIRNQQIDRSARTMIMERLDALNLELPEGVDPLFVQRSEVGHHTAAISLFAGASSGHHDAALQQLMEFRQQLLDYPISEKELKFYRDDMDAYIKANLNTKVLPDSTAKLTRMALGAFSGRPVIPVGEKVSLYKEIMATITADDVNQRIQSWMNASDRSVMFQMNAEDAFTLPTAVDLNHLEKQVQEMEIAAPRDIEDIGGGAFQFELQAGAIKSKKIDPYYKDVQTWTLGNGDQFVWLKSDSVKDDVLFRSSAKIGYLAQDLEGWKARLASQFVWMSAPQGYDLQTLGTWRRRNSIVFRNALGPERFQIKGQSGVEHIEEIFKAYAAYQLSPKIDDDFMTMQLAGIKSSLLNRDDSGQQVREAEEALRYKVNHLTVPEVEQLEQIKKSELLGLWQQISNTPNTFFVVANIPAQEMESLVVRYLAGIPRSSKVYQFNKEVLASGTERTTLKLDTTERTDIDAWSWKQEPWSIESTQQLNLARRLAHTALKQALRGEEKAVYSVAFDSVLMQKDQQIYSHLHFNAQPEKTEKLWKLSQQVLANLPGKLTQKQLDAEKLHVLKIENNALTNPQVWLGRLELSFQQYGDARVLSEMQNLDQNTQLSDIKAMMKNMWPQENVRVLQVSPAG